MCYFRLEHATTHTDKFRVLTESFQSESGVLQRVSESALLQSSVGQPVVRHSTFSQQQRLGPTVPRTRSEILVTNNGNLKNAISLDRTDSSELN